MGSVATESRATLPTPGEEELLGRTVLLVDDNQLVLRQGEAILEKLGHTPLTAACGEIALARVASGCAPDITILDVNMPGLSGAQTLQRLRALHPAMPIILISGWIDEEAEALAASHAAVTLLAKPFTLRELQAELGLLSLTASPIATAFH